MRATEPQIAYKEALVTEMREFVDTFHSEMCTKITAIMKKYERAMKEISTRRCTKQPTEFEDLFKASSTNRITNPIYSGSPEEHSFDLKKKHIGVESRKCILLLSQPLHSPNPAVLNRARTSSNPESTFNSLLSNDIDGLPVARPKDDRRETNLYKSKVKRS